MIHTLEEAGQKKAAWLLRADRNLRRRALETDEDKNKKVREEKESQGHHVLKRGTLLLEEDMQKEVEEAEDIAEKYLNLSASHTNVLELVRRYRETFGALLAAGSELLELEGEERFRFERRMENEEELDHGGLILGAGREGPAEKAFGIDV
jgi:sulfur relay (sulfurtransferase) DsrC/TusE family protein